VGWTYTAFSGGRERERNISHITFHSEYMDGMIELGDLGVAIKY
jgi:hypothetical protein